MSRVVEVGQIWKEKPAYAGMTPKQYRMTRTGVENGKPYCWGKEISNAYIGGESPEIRFGELDPANYPGTSWINNWEFSGISTKIEVGQVLVSGEVAYRITAIVGREVRARRCDPRTHQNLPGYEEGTFGSVDANGKADWMNGWRQVTPLPLVPVKTIQVGEIYRNKSYHDTIWKVTKIENRVAYGERLDTLGKPIGSPNSRFGDLNSDGTAPWQNSWEVLPENHFMEQAKLHFKAGVRVLWNNQSHKPEGVTEWIGTSIGVTPHGHVKIRFDQYKYTSAGDFHEVDFSALTRTSMPIPTSSFGIGSMVELIRVNPGGVPAYTVHKGTNFSNKVVLEEGSTVAVGDSVFITRRLETAPAVAVGDQVVVTTPEGMGSYNLTGTYVGNNVVYLDKPYNSNGKSSWRCNDSTTKEKLQLMGLDSNASNCWQLGADSAITKITAKAADVSAAKAAAIAKLTEELNATKYSLSVAKEETAKVAAALEAARIKEANRENQLDVMLRELQESEVEEELEEENMTVAIKDVNKGDIVEVKFMDANGDTFHMEGTVLKYMDTDKGPRTFILMDDEVDMPGTGWKTKYLSDCPKEVQKAAKELGFSDEGMYVLRAKDDAQYASIYSVLERAPVEEKTKPQKESINKEKRMSTEQGLGEMLKGNLQEAAWRTGATQMSNAVQAGILMMLKDKGMEEGKIAAVKELLSSEIGNALIRGAIGMGLLYTPGLKDDPRCQKLSEEMRISGMSKVGDEVFSAAFQYLLPAVQGVIQALPPIEQAAPAGVRKAIEASGVKTKHRVADAPAGSPEEIEEEYSEEEETTNSANA